MPKRAETDQQIEDCFEVLAELRPHLEPGDFLATVRAMEGEGYKLAYIKDNERVVAVAAYRTYTNLFMGKHLSVDDLVTTQAARSEGYGGSYWPGYGMRRMRRVVRCYISIRAHSGLRLISFILGRVFILPAFILVSSCNNLFTPGRRPLWH